MRGLFAILTVLLTLTGAGAAAERFECTVIADVASGAIIRRDGDCARRAPPASSFKLPLAAMGFDSGVLIDEHTPLWPYKASYDAPKRDHKPVDPTVWERDSVLWYSRELVQRMGANAFVGYVRRFDYGNADVSGDAGQANGLTHSWLSSSLQVSGDEQLRFVLDLLNGRLPVKPDAAAKAIAVLPAFEAGEWRVQGKTGSIWLRQTNGRFDRKAPVGWFVGWASKDGRRVAFARLSVGKVVEGNAGPHERTLFLKRFPRLVGQ